MTRQELADKLGVQLEALKTWIANMTSFRKIRKPLPRQKQNWRVSKGHEAAAARVGVPVKNLPKYIADKLNEE